MTGFGSGRAAGPAGEVNVAVRTVNHRYLDVGVSLPRRLRGLEPRVKALAQVGLERGKLDVVVQAVGAAGEEASLAAPEAITSVVAALQRVAALPGVEGGVRLADVLRFPGVVSAAEPGPEAGEPFWPLVEDALKAAVDGLLAMRRDEGARLADALLVMLAEIEAAAGRLEAASAASKATRRELVLGRLRDLVAELGVDDARFVQEASRQADRLDVAEELQRLRSHVAQARGLIAGTGAAGRKLDFLSQELMREANTIGSKAADAALTAEVVGLKAEIERFREQVQNVE
jgi:uncharacterized protein (TIGR00255 family)